MTNDAEAQRAIAAINGKDLGGRTLNVNEARPKTDRASAEQAYENAIKLLTKLVDPAEVAALDKKSKQLRTAIDDRVPK